MMPEPKKEGLLTDLDLNVESSIVQHLHMLPEELLQSLQHLYPLLPQTLPLAVIIIFPLLFLTAANSTTLSWQLSMVFDSLSSFFSWSSSKDSLGSSDSSERKKLKKKGVKTRAEQIALVSGTASPNPSASTANGDTYTSKERSDGYYPGLVNMSGTYCFMNSTLQALASLSYLQPHIDDTHARAVALDIATPVIDPLRDILHVLNTPRSYPTAERPIELIHALSTDPSGRKNPLLCSREHQDAQELFQLISESIKRETITVDKESLRDLGLGGISQPTGPSRRKDIGKTVFDGLTANRRSCVVCGYTEAVMHFAFDNLQLAVPRAAICDLRECLYEYTRLEKLTDCICRKCSLLVTHQKLLQEADRLTGLTAGDPNASTSRKKRARDARKLEARVRVALEEGRLEDDIPGIKMEKVYSAESTKQAMIARPPPVLALHLNRSVHYGYHATKNSCRVEFSEYLDLTPFTTSGQLSVVPNVPISSPSQVSTRSMTPTPPNCNPPRTFYKLSAVVCHYGQHSFGHYICYRRKPRSPAAGPARFLPSKLACPYSCECERCQRSGNIRVDDEFDTRLRPGYGWLRISDDSVSECGIESVMHEGSAAFMLFYEKIVQPRQSLVAVPDVIRGSEETLRPQAVQEASAVQLVAKKNEDRDENVRLSSAQGKILSPRIVRNVMAPRSPRSVSSKLILLSSESREIPSAPNGAPLKPLQNGHASNGAASSTWGPSSTSWYQQSPQLSSSSTEVRGRSSSVSASRDRAHSRHPSQPPTDPHRRGRSSSSASASHSQKKHAHHRSGATHQFSNSLQQQQHQQPQLVQI